MDDRKISVSLATMQLKADGEKTTLMVTEQGVFLDATTTPGRASTARAFSSICWAGR